MTHTILILVIVCGAMFAATQAIDLIFNWFGISSQQQSVQPRKCEHMTERVLDSLQLQEHYSPHHISTINACELKADIACNQTINSFEELSEGLEATAESAGEYIFAILDGLSSS